MGRMYSTALTPFSPLLAWYDRGPLDRSLSYLGTDIGPHAPTVRGTYTVPTGKKAFVGGSGLEILRKTAAAPAGVLVTYLTYGPFWTFSVHTIDNTVGAAHRSSVTVQGVLLAGQTFTLLTSDSSTGGTVDYTLSAVIQEFNA